MVLKGDGFILLLALAQSCPTEANLIGCHLGSNLSWYCYSKEFLFEMNQGFSKFKPKKVRALIMKITLG